TEGTLRVAAALERLDGWWRRSRAEPIDVLLARILDETGLLPFAASQLLGDNRGGALLHLVEAVRGPALEPAPDLRRAIETIDRVLDTDAPDALLMPGRSGAVRVMNLHKAKGLEAKVVVLAGPCRYKKHPPDFTVVRGDDHAVRGWMMVRDKREKTVALPPRWDALAKRETEFVEAEKARLLYVAATRAKYELVVARSALDETDTYEVPWLPLGETLDRLAGTLELQPDDPPAREVAPVTAEEIAARAAELEARRAQASAAGWQRTTVTQETKRPLDAPAPDDHVRHIGRGKKWGTVVHRVLEARGRGRTGESLRRFANAVIAQEAATGSVDDLLALVSRLEAEGHFAPGGLVEVPIVTCENGVIREGVIDAARLEGDRWIVMDWKTDLDASGGDPGRRAMYQEQVDAYAAMLRELTGQDAVGRLIPLGG
ncbi:MAG TPA: 3'-5' exonuclease, partial [Gemmatimonadales bacterium]|nr:3'-5' exonuclease [Gemmatimonadales bacterium]